ncbi:hypothetical protein NP233_g7924 [Leucocoprinus birnbaumii]|uniref:Uncharacterized protein n=1 Tax=Leucocoprinus birnbaumii TaxID=56174 RepID=A0AAD5VND6_9AGAR|nr:hypothetical protein NP233_g7924 [Leucocoprinus birnbaumii]
MPNSTASSPFCPPPHFTELEDERNILGRLTQCLYEACYARDFYSLTLSLTSSLSTSAANHIKLGVNVRNVKITDISSLAYRGTSI